MARSLWAMLVVQAPVEFAVEERTALTAQAIHVLMVSLLVGIPAPHRDVAEEFAMALGRSLGQMVPAPSDRGEIDGKAPEGAVADCERVEGVVQRVRDMPCCMRIIDQNVRHSVLEGDRHQPIAQEPKPGEEVNLGLVLAGVEVGIRGEDLPAVEEGREDRELGGIVVVEVDDPGFRPSRRPERSGKEATVFHQHILVDLEAVRFVALPNDDLRLSAILDGKWGRQRRTSSPLSTASA
ncbi:hypothetical protein LTR53_013999 [Teratosphaeriaceae sp. CCFEE 6253]|nr:hypothetical protein LTR53_013999 [Teratosphaeriaceae sp. CCFEE 6253]